MSKFIQSFYQYPVTFSSIGKTIPARNAKGEMRNIAEFTDKELERLQNCEPFFRELLDKKKIRVLNHIPASYIPAAQQINNAKDEADKAKAEAEKAKAEAEKLRIENEAFKARLAEMDSKAEEATEKESEAEAEEKKSNSSKKGKK